MQWSPQQDMALESVRKWLGPGKWVDDNFTGSRQIFRLFGYAGTGKTTLAIQIAKMVDGEVLFGAFTGKAALVMRKKGCHGAATLHSLIYKPRRKHRDDDHGDHEMPAWELNPESPVKGASLLIIDECSMVGEDLARDVLSFGTPVLVLGDPAQLPPVSGAGYFTDARPDVMLTEIHRQAAENPIVRIATDIRTGVGVRVGNHAGPTKGTGVSIITRDRLLRRTEMGAGQILCGKNDTRVGINKRMRQRLREDGMLPKGDHLPVVGDRVICLKNKRESGLLNGGMWSVVDVLDKMPDAKRGRKGMSYLEIDSLDDMGVNYAKVPQAFWYWNNKLADLNIPDGISRKDNDEFDYAYAVTCHKSQGSQWDKVLVFDESQVFGRDDDSIPARWLYTAATRAAEALVIVL